MILRDIRKQVENIINQSGLPIDCIYFLFKDIMNEIESIYNQEIMREDAEARSKDSETESEDPKSEVAANNIEEGGQE